MTVRPAHALVVVALVSVFALGLILGVAGSARVNVSALWAYRYDLFVAEAKQLHQGYQRGLETQAIAYATANAETRRRLVGVIEQHRAAMRAAGVALPEWQDK